MKEPHSIAYRSVQYARAHFRRENQMDINVQVSAILQTMQPCLCCAEARQQNPTIIITNHTPCQPSKAIEPNKYMLLNGISVSLAQQLLLLPFGQPSPRLFLAVDRKCLPTLLLDLRGSFGMVASDLGQVEFRVC
jgi:hypothetical protein